MAAYKVQRVVQEDETAKIQASQVFDKLKESELRWSGQGVERWPEDASMKTRGQTIEGFVSQEKASEFYPDKMEVIISF